jgi:hypothetical protein
VAQPGSALPLGGRGPRFESGRPDFSLAVAGNLRPVPRLGRLTKVGAAYYGVLIVALVVGIVIGGGLGTTIAAIAGILLAGTIFIAFGGIGMAERDAFSGRRTGREREAEEERRRRQRD